jgi:hypothetical protein
LKTSAVYVFCFHLKIQLAGERREGRREKGEGDKKHVHITIRGRKHIRRGSFT